MDREKKYYKVVVQKKNGRLYSGWVHSNNYFRTEYKIGEFVFPKVRGTKILVFASKSAAIKWTGNISDRTNDTNDSKGKIRVFECSIINPVKITTLPCILNFFRRFDERHAASSITDWWADIYTNLVWYLKQRAPDGTVGVDAVKLLKEVK